MKTNICIYVHSQCLHFYLQKLLNVVVFTRLYSLYTQGGREEVDCTCWDPCSVIPKIVNSSLHVCLPDFNCIPTVFVLICTGNVINKLIYSRRHTKIPGKSVTGMKMGSEMKQWHFILSVNMVNWHGCQQVCRRPSADHLHMCSGFPAKMMEQTIMTSLNDVMRISHA